MRTRVHAGRFQLMATMHGGFQDDSEVYVRREDRRALITVLRDAEIAKGTRAAGAPAQKPGDEPEGAQWGVLRCIYPADNLRPDEKELGSLLEPSPTADRWWELEVRASPNRKRWGGGYSRCTESLERRELMRAIEATRRLTKLSDQLHMIVAARLMEALFYDDTSEGGQVRDGTPPYL